MQTRNIKSFVNFSAEEIQRQTVFETPRLWSQVLCFERNQSMGPVTDQDSDAIFTVIAGEAVFMVDNRRKRLDQWGAVLVPAGSQVTITNASGDPLVVLLTTAPPPGASSA